MIDPNPKPEFLKSYFISWENTATQSLRSGPIILFNKATLDEVLIKYYFIIMPKSFTIEEPTLGQPHESQGNSWNTCIYPSYYTRISIGITQV